MNSSGAFSTIYYGSAKDLNGKVESVVIKKLKEDQYIQKYN